MRYAIVLLAVLVSVAPPAAAQSATLPYSLTFSGTMTRGTISGDWGGRLAQGDYANGRWALFSGGSVAVEGTYRCDTGCTFDGVVDYATPTKVSLYVETLGTEDTSQKVTGSLPLRLTPPTLVP